MSAYVVVEALQGGGSLTSGALVRFSDRETDLGWYDSPEHQRLVGVRGGALDARFGLLDDLPAATEEARESA